MKRHFSLRALALCLALSLLLTACGGGANATTMRLKRSEGTVSVADGGGKTLEPRENLGLYSGYGVDTQAVSYAWLDLDSTKLAKLDENSAISIEKEGKKLAVSVDSGSFFFNITQPLEEDETLSIRTSSMAVGIRGTCGWVDAEQGRVYILEGTVTAVAATAGMGVFEVPVTAGEMAQAVDGTVTVVPFSAGEVPAFVRAELEQDEALAAEILDASGLDVLSPVPDAGAVRAEYDNVLAEWQPLRNLVDLNADDPFAAVDQLDWSTFSYIPQNSDLVYYGGPDCYAYYDLDGNGVEELILGQSYGAGAYPVSVYGFNGTQAVHLMEYDLYVSILADGLILATDPGSYVEGVFRIGADGFTLEAVTDSDITVSTGFDPNNPETAYLALIDVQDFSAHGGFLDDTLDWTPLN